MDEQEREGGEGMSLIDRPIEFIAKVRKVGDGKVTASVTIPSEITNFYRLTEDDYLRITIEEIKKKVKG